MPIGTPCGNLVGPTNPLESEGIKEGTLEINDQSKLPKADAPLTPPCTVLNSTVIWYPHPFWDTKYGPPSVEKVKAMVVPDFTVLGPP